MLAIKVVAVGVRITGRGEETGPVNGPLDGDTTKGLVIGCTRCMTGPTEIE